MDAITKSCVIPSQCSNNSYADNYTGSCVSQCIGSYGDSNLHRCITPCYGTLYGDAISRTCVSNCSGGLKNNIDTHLCDS
jgi:hypothetical protein